MNPRRLDGRGLLRRMRRAMVGEEGAGCGFRCSASGLSNRTTAPLSLLVVTVDCSQWIVPRGTQYYQPSHARRCAPPRTDPRGVESSAFAARPGATVTGCHGAPAPGRATPRPPAPRCRTMPTLTTELPRRLFSRLSEHRARPAGGIRFVSRPKVGGGKVAYDDATKVLPAPPRGPRVETNDEPFPFADHYGRSEPVSFILGEDIHAARSGGSDEVWLEGPVVEQVDELWTTGPGALQYWAKALRDWMTAADFLDSSIRSPAGGFAEFLRANGFAIHRTLVEAPSRRHYRCHGPTWTESKRHSGALRKRGSSERYRVARRSTSAQHIHAARRQAWVSLTGN